MIVLIVVGVLVALIAIVNLAAHRFVREQRRKGRWDDEGPLVETEGPPRSFRGGGMDERREVVGEWVAPIVKDRRPSKPHSTES